LIDCNSVRKLYCRSLLLMLHN